MTRKTLAVLAGLVLLAACESTSPRVPASVQADRQSVTIPVGDTVRVQAVVLDQDGRAYDVPPDGFAITWSSSNAQVATVDGSGLITGVGAGQTTVLAQAGDLPPAQVQVQVEGTLNLTNGTFDLPRLFADDPDELVVTAQIGFSYSGHRAGSFAVSETFQVGDISVGGSYAYTFHNIEFDDQDFIAWQRRGDGRLDYMEFYVEGGITAPGTYAVYLGFILFGFDPVAETAEEFYLLEAQPGTVTVTAATEDNLVGTFSMTMDVEPLDAASVAASPAGVLSTPNRVTAPTPEALRQLRRAPR